MFIIKRTKAKAEETKKLIFISALKIFGEKGYSKTSLEDIAGGAGVSRGAIYWNFENKQELYTKLLKEYFYNNIYEALLSSITHGEDPLQELIEYMYNYLYIIIKDKDVRNFLEIIRYKTEVKTELSIVLEVQQEMDILIKTEITRLVERGVAGGKIRSDVDESVIVMAILSFLNGIEDTWLMNNEIYPLRQKYKQLIDFFISSIIKR